MAEDDVNRNTEELQGHTPPDLELVIPEVKYRPVPFDPVTKELENRPVWRIRLDLATDTQRRLGFDINGEVILGRDVEEGNLVDLQAFDASSLGVSRRHLMLRPSATHLYAIDVGSTNGTLRNGRSIGIKTPYSLSDGDVLTLGQLRLVLHIIEKPQFQTGVLERKIDLADAMTEIAKSITSQLDLDEVLNQVVEAAMNLTSAGETSIWLVDETSGELFLEAQRGIEDEAIQRLRLPIDEDTPAGKVIQTGQPLRVWRQPGEDQIKVKTNYLVEALAYVPITLGGVTFGVLAATHRQPGKRFDRRDERLLTAIADFAAIAIQNARMYQATDAALGRRYKELSALNEVARAVSSSLDLDKVYEVLIEEVNKHWPVEAVLLCLMDDSGKSLRAFRAHTSGKDTKPFAIHDGIIGLVAQTGQAVMTNNPADHEAFYLPVDSVNAIRPQSMISVPLHVQDHVVGVLTLFNKENGVFTKDDLTRLETFANPMATAVENARLFKESERQRAAIQATAQMLSQPLIIVDDAGNVLIANEAAKRLLESNMAQLFDGVSQGVGRTAEVKIGNETYLSTAEHLPDVGTIVVMQDITYVKQLEADRSDFLHMLSHDLKNPLTAITGWKALLERTVQFDKRSERYLNQIGVAVDRMLEMIAQLLDTVTQDAVIQLIRKPCDFDIVVNRVLKDVSGAALYKSITINAKTTGTPYAILADENRLYHMVLNLVDNAVKYSPRSTEVGVLVDYMDEALSIRVQDDGPGIPEEDLPYVFDKYFRGTAAKMQPGSGLGLSSVMGIAQAHDGTVQVENRPEGGTVFTITLPGSLRCAADGTAV
ncbi:MAG: GAF domain-containing protein [Anaerolineales bacterium]|nr:GAF domain-containing protein [Anaerolineales bacterium]